MQRLPGTIGRSRNDYRLDLFADLSGAAPGSLRQPALAVVIRAELRTNSPCSVVLQCLLPENTSERVERTAWAWEIEHTIPCDTAVDVPLYIYNFSDQTVRGEIVVERLPADTSITPDRWEVVLEPQERRLLPAQVRINKDSGSESIKLRGDFGAAGRPVLALRLRSSQSETTKNK